MRTKCRHANHLRRGSLVPSHPVSMHTPSQSLPPHHFENLLGRFCGWFSTLKPRPFPGIKPSLARACVPIQPLIWGMPSHWKSPGSCAQPAAIADGFEPCYQNGFPGGGAFTVHHFRDACAFPNITARTSGGDFPGRWTARQPRRGSRRFACVLPQRAIRIGSPKPAPPGSR